MNTVLVGTESGIVEEEVTGGYRRIIRVPANPKTLQEVAAGTNGQFFAAPDAEGLQKVRDGMKVVPKPYAAPAASRAGDAAAGQ